MRKIVLLAVAALGLSVGPRYACAEETDQVTTTIVYDNYPYAEGLKTDWGFGCLVQGMDKTILFDTGRQGDVFMANMEALKLDPCSVDIVVISHFHGDHTGGLDAFLERNSKVTVYVPAPKRDEFAQRLGAKGVEVVWVDEPRTLCPNVHLTGSMGERIIEQSLILDTGEGAVLITGCSHPGIVEILHKTKEILDRPIYAAFGGFHLSQHSRAQVERIIREFKALGVTRPGPTHCTGGEAIAQFREAFGDKCLKLGVGRVLRFPKRSATGATSVCRPAEITYIANEGFMIECGGKKVLVDAMFDEGYGQFMAPARDVQAKMARAEAPFDDVNLVLVTHDHGDHFAARMVADHLANNRNAQLVAHGQAVEQLRDLEDYAKIEGRVHEVADEMGAWSRLTVNGIRVDALCMKHGAFYRDGKNMHENKRNVVFVVSMGGRRFCHAGDARLGADAEPWRAFPFAQEGVDVLFLPYWDTSSAAKNIIAERIRPRSLVGMHIPPAGLAAVSAKMREAYPDAIVLRSTWEKHRVGQEELSLR
jgi:7,8-dihydropterin-6-yl-methyl-4-(beta-D-ribofuranosyl)aminobenzene 5'-phosphate synthase